MSSDDKQSDADNICKDPDKYRAGQGWKSFGISCLNLVGMGGILESNSPTSLDKIQQQISKIQSENQQYTNDMSYYAIQAQSKMNQQTLAAFKGVEAYMNEEMKFNDEILQEKITLNTYYIAYLFVLVIISVIFLYFIL